VYHHKPLIGSTIKSQVLQNNDRQSRSKKAAPHLPAMSHNNIPIKPSFGAFSHSGNTLKADELHSGYCVIIRTFNSESALPETLASLDQQSIKPSRVIIVDSGSTDNTLALVPQEAIVHRYTGEGFNYSEAINQGLQYVDTEFVAIVSSHTVLECPLALGYALQLFGSDGLLGAVYFSNEESPVLAHELIDKDRFTGHNGIWNTASVIRTSLVRSRPFRPEVFSAEDQEWSRWLLEERRQVIARINGSRQRNLNPRHHSRRKMMNEYLSIALFTKPDLFSWRNIVMVGLGAAKPCLDRSLSERMFKLELFFRLTLAHFINRRPESRYF
jgi:glycosyltransferase involved in cell wall biosynthesis